MHNLVVLFLNFLQFLLAQFRGLSRCSGLNLCCDLMRLWVPRLHLNNTRKYSWIQGIYLVLKVSKIVVFLYSWLCYENNITWKTEKRPSWTIFYNISLRRDVISFLHNLGEKFRFPIWLIFPIFCSLTWTPESEGCYTKGWQNHTVKYIQCISNHINYSKTIFKVPLKRKSRRKSEWSGQA